MKANSATRHGAVPVFAAAVFAAALLTAPCAVAGGPQAEGVRAYVGGRPVTEGDVARVSGFLPGADDPAARLEYAIRRKALVQRALKDGMFRDPGYKEAVRAFREDALVGALLRKKSDELSGGIAVTDAELAAFTRRMCYTVSIYKAEFGTMQEAERFVEKGRAGRPREWDGEVTVVGCEDVGPTLADAVFALSEGEEKVVARGRRFTVVRLLDKKKTIPEASLPDRDSIREYLLEKKRAQALDDWVDKVVGEAGVKIVDAPSGR